MARSQAAKQPQEKTNEAANASPKDNGTATSVERGAAIATSPEAEEVGRLTAKIDSLEAEASQREALIDRQREKIAILENTVESQARQIGQLKVCAVQQNAEESLTGVSLEEYDAQREDGVVNFVVLRTWKSGWDGARFDKGQGIDARQFAALRQYIDGGLALAPMPESRGAA